MEKKKWHIFWRQGGKGSVNVASRNIVLYFCRDKPAVCVYLRGSVRAPIIYGVRYSVCTSSRIKYRGIFQPEFAFLRVCVVMQEAPPGDTGESGPLQQVYSRSSSHVFIFFFSFFFCNILCFVLQKSLNLPSYFVKVVILCFVYVLCTLPSFILLGVFIYTFYILLFYLHGCRQANG